MLEVFEPACKVKPNLSTNALRVLEKRYLRRNNRGEVTETSEEMFRRVAHSVTRAELFYDTAANVQTIENEFFDLMASMEFLPNSPTILNAGTRSGTLSSCFVLPVPDSVEETFDTVKHTAIIHKSGGGIGFDLSALRPKGSSVNGRPYAAGGPVALANVLSSSADYIRQGGVRRGCNSMVLSVDHPDILDFVIAKADPNTLTNFYNSVAVSDHFMAQVKANGDYPLIDPHTHKITRWLSAREVFGRIVDQAWRTGDPGLAFIDRINRDNPTPSLGQLSAITGCGEQSLLSYESTNLGSINLVKMLKDSGDGLEIDFDKLAHIVPLAVRFLDNVIDINRFPVPEIECATKRTRKIGLGVMGFADMLLRLGIPYNSTKAIAVAESLMEFVTDTAHETSQQLAKERGNFPAWGDSLYARHNILMRNACCTTIAPTGTLSIIAGVSSGIEPIFASVFVRNILDGENLLEINPYFEEVAKARGFFTQELIEQLVTNNHLHSRTEIPEDVRKIFVTAHRVTPDWHVRIQAAFQRHTDSAVSKTVNFPKNATRDDIARVFNMAFEQGLKGITVYRDRSRDLQPLSMSETGIQLVDCWFDAEKERRAAI
ncbi:adenosylcobalamin-dependent ribonucleoside-diphosphate reductase [Dehalogenimonas etheniformans]|uniref:Vitamin B12-dependent ribonucleotide reductase n=1 Tax=Dehalogenimonas etheniformans TaxID=1536648 RepID=A0A2P5P5K7_9CHLR|nr:adenosylcobalamin-dependent ribonucleoside-diphosphate reductase [Dehalogenimonas etheniformans]PPD57570.1 adenosylcobalamin-dependent ribonucleoside-diphosphate reductase [Dehalogenimonas etheniformans]QNT75908.1 adenosylcobalamin-dependent ribonucleoside-diphosphate reductase [Dehalogenimonas etheniformans]